MCIVGSVELKKMFGVDGHVDFLYGTRTMHEKCKSRALKASVKAAEKARCSYGKYEGRETVNSEHEVEEMKC